MRFRRRVIGVVVAAGFALGVAAPAAFAMGGGPPCDKPGYGYGDRNHCHYGPPGQGYTPQFPYFLFR